MKKRKKLRALQQRGIYTQHRAINCCNTLRGYTFLTDVISDGVPLKDKRCNIYRALNELERVFSLSEALVM